MFSEVERRFDTLAFRACFAESLYEARRLILHGDVYVEWNQGVSQVE
jgi:ribosomal protein S4